MLIIDSGVVNNDGRTGDSTYYGSGINIGTGISIKIAPEVALKGEIIYRNVSFSSVDDGHDIYSLSDSIDGSGLCFGFGVNLYLN